jgi:hypothetical protein
MAARLIVLMAVLAIWLCAQFAPGQTRTAASPEKKPVAVDVPEKRSRAAAGRSDLPSAAKAEDDEDDEGEDDDQDQEEDGKQQQAIDKDAGEDPAAQDAGLTTPPRPARAPIPSMRHPRIYSEPLGPPPPPVTWSQTEIAEAKSECERLLDDKDFEFKVLEPIRAGPCGTPAPIQLKTVNHEPKVTFHPPVTVTCPLASAVDRWMKEVVQPSAKAHLESNIVQVANVSGYQCRSRYNDSSQPISYHAFAQAIDIGEFITEKGEHITVLEHWPGTDKRAQFLRDIHDGACKIFGTVLGPEANAAHKNHFHLDMAKRRHSAYCE